MMGVTGSTKSTIRRDILQDQRQQSHDRGRQLVDRAFRQEGYDLTDKAVNAVLKKLKAESVADVYAAVGQGNVTAREVLVAVFPGVREQERGSKVVPLAKARKAKGKDPAVPIRSEERRVGQEGGA